MASNTDTYWCHGLELFEMWWSTTMPFLLVSQKIINITYLICVLCNNIDLYISSYHTKSVFFCHNLDFKFDFPPL